MPSLNQEILFDIAETVIQAGDYSQIYKFTLSGKTCWKAMEKIFSSVTKMEIYKDHYILWKNQEFCSKGFLDNLQLPMKPFLKYVGNSLEALEIHGRHEAFDCVIENARFSPKLSWLRIKTHVYDEKIDDIVNSSLKGIRGIKLPSSIIFSPHLNPNLSFDTLEMYEEINALHPLLSNKSPGSVLFAYEETEKLRMFIPNGDKHASFSTRISHFYMRGCFIIFLKYDLKDDLRYLSIEKTICDKNEDPTNIPHLKKRCDFYIRMLEGTPLRFTADFHYSFYLTVENITDELIEENKQHFPKSTTTRGLEWFKFDYKHLLTETTTAYITFMFQTSHILGNLEENQ